MSNDDSAPDSGPDDGAKEAPTEADAAGQLGSGSLGAFIRAQRELANLSLRQLSGMAEVSNAYLSQIERNLHEPSIRVLKNVGAALGIEPETLLAHTGLITEDSDASRSGIASVEEAIGADPHISDAEKQALLSVYRSYRSAKD